MGGLVLIVLTALAVLVFTKGEFEIIGGRKIDAETSQNVGCILVGGIILTLMVGGLVGLGVLLIALFLGLINSKPMAKPDQANSDVNRPQ